MGAWLRWGIILLSVLSASCKNSNSPTNMTDLELWIKEAQKHPYLHKPIPLITSLKNLPGVVDDISDVDPFDESRISTYLSKVGVFQKSNSYMPSYEMLLQTVAVDHIALVGIASFVTGNDSEVKKEALVSVLGKTFCLRVGDLLAENGGVIESINADSIAIIQYVDNGSGEFLPVTKNIPLQNEPA